MTVKPMSHHVSELVNLYQSLNFAVYDETNRGYVDYSFS